jgi:hypothetical protein
VPIIFKRFTITVPYDKDYSKKKAKEEGKKHVPVTFEPSGHQIRAFQKM